MTNAERAKIGHKTFQSFCRAANSITSCARNPSLMSTGW